RPDSARHGIPCSQPDSEGGALDLLDYVRILRRGWPVVLAFVIAGLAAGIGIALATTKIYQANDQIFVATSGGSDLSQLAQGATFAQQRVQTYVNFVGEDPITKAVARDPAVLSYEKANGLPLLTYNDVASRITADAPLNEVLINLHATDHDPRLAALLANKAADRFSKYIEGMEQKDARGRSVVMLHPQGAKVPTAPIKPNKVLDIGLGFVVGLLLGVGVVILRDVLDNTVKGPADFEEIGVPVLGMVPLDKRTQRTPIAFRGDPHSARSEAYRQLRTNFQFINVDQAPRVIAVTSAIPGEGKTTTAMNLAAALADAGHRVVLVEADLRRPTIAKTLGLVPDVGFTTVLIGQAPLEAALQNAGRNLAVLTSGPVPPNPSELLISEQARSLIRSVAEQADYTIIDTAPLLPVADGSEVAALADATLVVHRASKTTREQAARSAEALAKVGERAVGVVLNMITRSTGRYEYEYSYAYTYRPDRTHEAARRAKAAPRPTAERDATLDAVDQGEGLPVGSRRGHSAQDD
ncbi:MAG TPA: polysaccharide biosynthesis tyrosine autokinase, partial [Jatrophihabitans sp.]|nr:polysaccharide biosynthesis tyrosine autokinase [Jatrophihabitans sp.]